MERRRDREREIDGEKERQRDRERYRWREGETEREIDGEKETHREKHSGNYDILFGFDHHGKRRQKKVTQCIITPKSMLHRDLLCKSKNNHFINMIC